MTLSRELQDPRSPLRVWLATSLPGLATAMRPAWRAALLPATLTVPAPVGHPAVVLGHAINERIVWEHSPLAYGHPPAVRGARVLTSMGATRTFIDQLVIEAASKPTGDPLRTARTACILGLVDRAYRSGRVDEPWYPPLLTAKDLDEALASIPAEWAVDVAAVANLALPQLAHLTGHPIPGPDFTGSGLVGGADGDLILGSTLVEIKAIKSPDLALRYAQQLACYALLDTDDEYELASIAILSARFGVLVTWQLEELINEAGKLSLREARGLLAAALQPKRSRASRPRSATKRR